MSATTHWLARVEAMCDSAEAGPWTAEEPGIDGVSTVRDADGNAVFAHDGWRPAQAEPADALFVAGARTDLPRAVTALRAVLEVADRLGDPRYTGVINMHAAADMIREQIDQALTEDPA